MAADFAQPAPANPDKVDELHARESIPAAPQFGRRDMVAVFLPAALGLVFAVGAVAMAFQARASWESHRDWVVPTTIPFLVLGGLGFGYLAARLKLAAMGPAILLLTLTLFFGFLNILRGYMTEGDDGLRDALSIITGILLGATIVAAVVAFAREEIRDPVRPPGGEAG